MKTQALATLAAVSVLFTAVAAHADDAVPAHPVNPDTAQPKLAPAHVFVQLGGGASVSSVDAGSVHYISEHAHFDLAVGHELFVTPLGSDRLSIGLGYAGSMDVSSDEVLHRHGLGFTFRKSWFFATVSGGASFLHDFADASVLVGGHVGLDVGFRLGPVQLAFPIYVDAFNLPVTTFGATLGFQI
jgi:hypothetical protein